MRLLASLLVLFLIAPLAMADEAAPSPCLLYTFPSPRYRLFCRLASSVLHN